jgi:hypothetical protein
MCRKWRKRTAPLEWRQCIPHFHEMELRDFRRYFEQRYPGEIPPFCGCSMRKPLKRHHLWAFEGSGSPKRYSLVSCGIITRIASRFLPAASRVRSPRCWARVRGRPATRSALPLLTVSEVSEAASHFRFLGRTGRSQRRLDPTRLTRSRLRPIDKFSGSAPQHCFD